jgi:hypothetical protein
VNSHPTHKTRRIAIKAALNRMGAICPVEKGMKVAWVNPNTMVVRTNPNKAPPIAHSARFLPAL